MKLIPLEAGEPPGAPEIFLKKEVMYLPFYLFSALYSGGREVLYLVDALRGKTLRVEGSLMEKAVEAKFRFPAKISPLRAEELLLPEARFPMGLLFRTRLKNLRFRERVLYPFVVYYRRKGKGYTVDVFDGLSGKKENLFAKEMVIDMLINQKGGER